MVTIKKILELWVSISNRYCFDVDVHYTASEFNTKSEFCYEHLIWSSADKWLEFDKIPVTLSVRLETFFYFRSWRGQMHREKLTWKHCKWKLIGSGKEGETVNLLGPNGCKNKWICANSEVVSWLPKQMRYCKNAKTYLEWTRNLMFAISLADTLTILWIYLTGG